MKFGPVPLQEAAGKILAHNLLDTDGRKLFNKGHVLTTTDVQTLSNSNIPSVIVADLDRTDLGENEAARRVGLAVAGPNVRVTAPGVGRANLIAESAGPLCVNVPLLNRLNNIDEGITIATLREHTLVHPRQLLALVKIIPFAIPAARVIDAESIAGEAAPVIWVRPLQRRSVSLSISGPESAHRQLRDDFVVPVTNRIESLGSTIDDVVCVSHDSASISTVLLEQCAKERDLILLAGVSAIIDRGDVVPTALLGAGGTITHFGVPVDPGSLLMLGYLGAIPVVGAPGCIKSPKTNVIDWILPRLLAGERLTRADLVVMGHGGLLEDISERPMPRNAATPKGSVLG
jgi:molybdenum cofactor cytidylyltransferase